MVKQDVLWDKLLDLAVILAGQLLLFCWKRFREIVTSVITKIPIRPTGRRELIGVIAGASVISCVLVSLVGASLFVPSPYVREGFPRLGWIAVAESLIVGLFVCWAITRTPTEQQSTTLRIASIAAVFGASVVAATFALLEFVYPTSVCQLDKLPILLIAIALLAASILSLRKLAKEERARTTQYLSRRLGDHVQSICVGFGLVGAYTSFMIAYLPIPVYLPPPWLNWFTLVASPVFLIIPLRLWLDAKRRADHRRITGRVAAICMLLFAVSTMLMSVAVVAGRVPNLGQ